jgi:hypothetical protein
VSAGTASIHSGQHGEGLGVNVWLKEPVEEQFRHYKVATRGKRLRVLRFSGYKVGLPVICVPLQNHCSGALVPVMQPPSARSAGAGGVIEC